MLQTLGISVVVDVARAGFTDDRGEAFEIGLVEIVCGDSLCDRRASLTIPDRRLLTRGCLLVQILPCRTKALY